MLKPSILISGTVASMLIGGISAASASDPFKYISAGEVTAALADVSKGQASITYFSDSNFREMVIVRERSGQVEEHANWNDYITVLDGDAILIVGGTPVGMKITEPGEMRGDSLQGGQIVNLHKGDIVTIPAGMPHQVTLVQGSHIKYLAVKTSR